MEGLHKESGHACHSGSATARMPPGDQARIHLQYLTSSQPAVQEVGHVA